MKLKQTMAFTTVAALAVTPPPTFGLDLQALVKQHGFEFRPKEEVPWGVRLEEPGRLVWVDANGNRYQIDPTRPINPGEVPNFVDSYLATHAKDEVALTAELLLQTRLPTEFALGKPLVLPLKSELQATPLQPYRASFAKVPIGRRTYEVICDFLFIEQRGRHFLVYRELREYSARKRSREPHCDLL